MLLLGGEFGVAPDKVDDTEDCVEYAAGRLQQPVPVGLVPFASR